MTPPAAILIPKLRSPAPAAIQGADHLGRAHVYGTGFSLAEPDSIRELRPGEADYEALQNASKRLADRYLTYHDEKRGTVSWMHWVGRATYHANEGWIELAWWHEMVPHLFQLRKQFTTYQLEQAAALRSIYSWRLLELLRQHADEDEEGELVIRHEDFCHAMQVPPSHVKHFGMLKRRILTPAVKELQDKDGWLITWEPKRSGRACL